MATNADSELRKKINEVGSCLTMNNMNAVAGLYGIGYPLYKDDGFQLLLHLMNAQLLGQDFKKGLSDLLCSLGRNDLADLWDKSPRNVGSGLGGENLQNHGRRVNASILRAIEDTIAGKFLPLSSPSEGTKYYALVGEGGVGKTQLALRYCELMSHVCDVIWFMSGDGLERFTEEMEDLMDELKIEYKGEPPKKLKQALAKKLNGRGRWLLVVDNFEGMALKDLTDRIPDRGGTVLLTTRNCRVLPARYIVEVKPFSDEEAMRLFNNILGEGRVNEDLMEEVGEVVGHVASAISVYAYFFYDMGLGVEAMEAALKMFRLLDNGVTKEVQDLIKRKLIYTDEYRRILQDFREKDLKKEVPFRKTKIILLGDSGSGKTHTVRELTSEEYVEERDRYTEALEINCVNSMTWEKDDHLNAQELSLASLRGQLVAEEVHSHMNEGENEQVEENREERRVLDIEEEDKVAQWSSYSSYLHSLIRRDEEKPSLSDSDERKIVADIYDFGGHEVYRAMSHFFMNNWAVYLIVLNLEDSSDELREQLSYYVSVVQNFAPEAKILVVGTRSSSVSSTKKEQVKEMALQVQKDQKTEWAIEIFYVENKKENEFQVEDDKEALKKCIKYIVQEMFKENEPKVPLLWSRMLDTLRRNRENEGIQVVKVDELSEVELGRTYDRYDRDKKHPSIVKFPPEEIESFIELMKEIGMLYHFDTPEELSDFIILDPDWLVEGMKGVVTIREAKKLRKENPYFVKGCHWINFIGTGIVTTHLLDLIASVYWKGNEEWKSYFMNLLQQQSLLYKIPGGIKGEEKYIVPPLLPKKPVKPLPSMIEFLTVKLKRCYPPLEVYKLSFGLVKRKGWAYEDRSTRYNILLKKKIPKLTFLSISCDSFGMRQRLSISILSKHLKFPLNKAVIDDLLSESVYDVCVKCPDCPKEDEEKCRLISLGDLLREETVTCDGCGSELVFSELPGYSKEEDEVTAEHVSSPRNVPDSADVPHQFREMLRVVGDVLMKKDMDNIAYLYAVPYEK